MAPLKSKSKGEDGGLSHGVGADSLSTSSITTREQEEVVIDKQKKKEKKRDKKRKRESLDGESTEIEERKAKKERIEVDHASITSSTEKKSKKDKKKKKSKDKKKKDKKERKEKEEGSVDNDLTSKKDKKSKKDKHGSKDSDSTTNGIESETAKEIPSPNMRYNEGSVAVMAPQPVPVLKTTSPDTPNAHRRKKSVAFTADTKVEDGDSIKALKAGLLLSPGQSKKTHPPNENKKAKKRARKAKAREKADAAMEGFEVHPALVYLQTYHTDRENWKFRKQKQNWLMRNWIDVVAVPDGPNGYDAALAAYMKGLESAGARDRLLREARNGVKKKEEGEDTDETKKALAERRRERCRVIMRALGHGDDADEDGSDKENGVKEVADDSSSSSEDEDSDSSS